MVFGVLLGGSGMDFDAHLGHNFDPWGLKDPIQGFWGSGSEVCVLCTGAIHFRLSSLWVFQRFP